MPRRRGGSACKPELDGAALSLGAAEDAIVYSRASFPDAEVERLIHRTHRRLLVIVEPFLFPNDARHFKALRSIAEDTARALDAMGPQL